jgi:hypothetical protein
MPSTMNKLILWHDGHRLQCKVCTCTSTHLAGTCLDINAQLWNVRSVSRGVCVSLRNADPILRAASGGGYEHGRSVSP